MKICYPSFYEKFVCSASECKDTCCKYWQVELDAPSKIKYETIIRSNNDIGFELKKAIKGNTFRNVKDSCWFLNDCGLCSLYLATDHDTLPRTCRLYPRFINNFGGYEERGLSFSCEVAAEIIVNNEFILKSFENDEPITEYTTVDADVFYTVKEIRDKILNYVRLYSGTLENLLNSLLDYAKTVGQHINSNEYEKALEVEIKDITNMECVLNYNDFKNIIIKKHLRNKILRNQWKDILNEALSNEPTYSLETFKIWASYFIFRYLIKAANNKDFYKTFTALVSSYIVISSLKLPFKTAAQLYSKEIEHNKYNTYRLFKFKFNNCIEKFKK